MPNFNTEGHAIISSSLFENISIAERLNFTK